MEDFEYLIKLIPTFEEDICDLERMEHEANQPGDELSTRSRFENSFYKKARAFANASRSVERVSKYIAMMDYDKPKLKHRAKVAANYAEKVRARYGEKYPQLCTEEAFFHVNVTAANSSYETLNLLRFLDFAAAIWILDELSASVRLTRAIRYIPVTEEAFDDFPVVDSVHDSKLILGLVRVIRGRFSENAVDNKTGPAFSPRTICAQPPEYSEPPEDAALTDRLRFNAIMALIRPVVRERAVTRFENKMWEVLERVLDAVNVYREKELEAIHRQRVLTQKLLSILKENASKPRVALMGKQDPLLMRFAAEERFPRRTECSELMTQLQQTEAEANEFWNKQRDVEALFPFKFSIEEMMEQTDADPRVMELRNDFSVGNPYEICFALLFLLDSGSELPWIYNQAYCVAETAADQLPWALMDREWNEEEDDEEEDEDEPEVPEEAAVEPDWSWETWAPIDRHAQEAKLYERCYTDVCLRAHPETVPKEKQKKISFAQLIYEYTTVLPPRDVSDQADEASVLELCGFETHEAALMEQYLTLANGVWNKHLSERICLQTKDKQPENVPEETTEALALKTECRTLKERINELHRERNELQRKLDDVYAENAALREKLRTQAAVPDEEGKAPEPQTAVDFPYAPMHRHVVFGGHPSWMREIRPLLPGVRFISKDMRPDAELIRHAETVWLQSNALSHADYYKIIGIVRENGIPIRYFSFASAVKCAEQLAEYDRTMETAIT